MRFSLRDMTAACCGGLLAFLAGPLRGWGQEEIRLPRSLLDQEPPARQEPPPGGEGKKPQATTAQERRKELEEKPDETAFYPIPSIASGKNEGWTFGLLGALLIPDEHGDINKVLSAAIQYRSKVGMNGFVDYRWTLSPSALLEAYSYWAAKVETPPTSEPTNAALADRIAVSIPVQVWTFHVITQAGKLEATAPSTLALAAL